MRPAPPGWPRASSSLFYEDAPAAIEFLQRAFGFEVRLRVDGPGGVIEHAELVYGDGLVMVSTAGRRPWAASPRQLGGRSTQSMFLYVDDVDAHFDRARAAGAEVDGPPEDHDYGAGYWCDRTYGCADLEGHRWWFARRVRTGG